MSSADSFILETLVDNLARFPTAQFGIMEEIAARLRQAERRPWMDETLNETFKCEKIPMTKSNQNDNAQKPDICPNISVQTGVGFSPLRLVNLPFCHLGLAKGRFSSP